MSSILWFIAGMVVSEFTSRSVSNTREEIDRLIDGYNRLLSSQSEISLQIAQQMLQLERMGKIKITSPELSNRLHDILNLGYDPKFMDQQGKIPFNLNNTQMYPYPSIQ